LGMRAIDSSHKISSNRVIFEKIFRSKHEKLAQIPVFYTYTLYFYKYFCATVKKLLK
jgi:hypothetical protein